MSADDYWGGSYWAGSYWAGSYWAEYGVYVPPPPVGAATYGQHVPTPKFPVYLLKLIRDYLESEVGD